MWRCVFNSIEKWEEKRREVKRRILRFSDKLLSIYTLYKFLYTTTENSHGSLTSIALNTSFFSFYFLNSLSLLLFFLLSRSLLLSLAPWSTWVAFYIKYNSHYWRMFVVKKKIYYFYLVYIIENIYVYIYSLINDIAAVFLSDNQSDNFYFPFL